MFYGLSLEIITIPISRSVKDMKKLSKAVVGAQWDTTFLEFITQLADRATVVDLLCKHPSPENFKFVTLRKTALKYRFYRCEHILNARGIL